MADLTHDLSPRGSPTRPPGRPAGGRSRRWLVAGGALVVVALALRLAFIEVTPDYALRHDARDYDVHARSIAQGDGYSVTLAHGRPTAFRPPGYPYLLAGVYRVAGVERAPVAERIEVARVAQAVIGTIVVALIGVLAAQLWGAAVAVAATAIAAVYVPLILIGGAVMSEPLFAAFMLGALVAAVAHRRSARRGPWFAVLAGALGGLAVLTRANAVVLLLPLAFAVWDGRSRMTRRAMAAPVALVITALLVVAPWTIRNAVVLDAFVPVSTQLGSALAGTYNDAAREDTENPASWRALKHVPQYAHLWRDVREIPEATLERELRSEALRYAADHPGYVAKVAFWSTLRMLDVAGRDWSRHTASTISVEPGWADAGVISFWIVALLALGGAVTSAARRAPPWLWAVPVLMFLSVVFLVVETPRYRTPIDPFLVMLAALAVSSVGARLGRARGSGRP